MKNILTKGILMHVFGFLLGSLVFVLLFKTDLFANTAFFYRGILLLSLTCLSIGGLLWFGKMRGALSVTYHDISLFIIILFCVNLVFFTHVPVTADRSISVFILGYMNAHGSRVVTQEELTGALTETYMDKNGALKKRIDEQLQIGTIEQEGGNFRISAKGTYLMRIYRLVANIFGVNTSNMSSESLP